MLVNMGSDAASGPMWRQRTTVPTVDNLDALGPLFQKANSLPDCTERVFFARMGSHGFQGGQRDFYCHNLDSCNSGCGFKSQPARSLSSSGSLH